MSVAPLKRRKLQVNLRAVVATLAVALAVVAGLAGLWMLQRQSSPARWLAESQKFADSGDINQALACLERCLAESPNHPEALERKSKILTDLSLKGLPEQARPALKAAEDAILATPDDPARQETRRRAIELNLRLGSAPAALTHARELVKPERNGNQPPSAEDEFLLGWALDESAAPGHREEGLAAFQRARQRDPGHVRAGLAAAQSLIELRKDRDGAQRVLDEMLKAAADPESARLQRHRFFQLLGRPGEASREIEQAAAQFPKNTLVRLMAAEDAIGRGDSKAGADHLDVCERMVMAAPKAKAKASDSASDSNPASDPPSPRRDLKTSAERAKYQLLRGRWLLDQGRADQAIEAWRRGLIESAGQHTELNFRLAHLLMFLGKLDDAQPVIDQHRRLTWNSRSESPSPETAYLLAEMAFRSNRSDEAIRLLEGIVAESPASIRLLVFRTLALARERRGFRAQAIDAYRQALELDSTRSDLRIAQARLLADAEPARAEGVLEDGLLKAPHDPLLLGELVEQLNRRKRKLENDPNARSEVQRIDRKLAEVFADSARGAGSTASLTLAQSRSRILEDQGKFAQAEDVLTAELRKSPRSLDLHVALAALRTRRNRIDDALKGLDEARETIGDAPALRVQKARTLTRANRRDPARSALIGGIDALPKSDQILLWAAAADFALDAWSDEPLARDALTRWARLAPDDLTPRVNLMNLAVAARDFETLGRLAAETDAIARNGLYPKLAEYWRIMAAASARDRDSEEAKARLREGLEVLNQVLAADDRQPMIHFLAGQVLSRLGRDDEAAVSWRNAADRNGGVRPLAELASLYGRLRKVDDLERLAREFPDHEALLRRYAAEAAMAAGDRNRALALAAASIKLAPDDYAARIWEAKFLGDAGDHAGAEQALLSLVESRPKEAGPWLALFQYYVGRDEPAKVRAKVPEMLKRTEVASKELLEAQTQLLLGDLKAARERFDAALKARPSDPEVVEKAVQFYEVNSLIDPAIAAVRGLIASGRQDQIKPAPAAIRKLAVLLSGKTHDGPAWQEALALLQGAATSQDPEDRFALAQVYLNGARTLPHYRRDALVLLDRLTRERPDDLRLRRATARAYADDNRLEDALPHAKAEAARGGDSALTFYAGLLVRLNRVDQARPLINALAQRRPDDLEIIELSARLDEAEGKTEAAAARLRDGLRRALDAAPNPDSGRRAVLFLYLSARVAKPAETIEAAQKVANAWPAVAPSCAATLISKQEYAAALQLCRTSAVLPRAPVRELAKIAVSVIVIHHPNPEPAHVRSAAALLSVARQAEPQAFDLIAAEAMLRHHQRDYQGELVLYESLLNRESLKTEAGAASYNTMLNNVAWTLSENLNRPEEGLKRINQAIADAGLLPSFLDTKGVILIRLKRYPEAIQILENVAYHVQSPASLHHLALAYRAAGQDARFRETFNVALKAGLNASRLQPDERDEFQRLLDVVKTPR